MKKKKSEPQVRWYHSETEDFVMNKNQDLKIPEDYVWVRTGRWDRIKAACIFHVARFIGGLYVRLFLHVRVKNRQVLKEQQKSGKGYFVFGNHTQEIGDVFIPALVCAPTRYYAVCAAANLGVPVLGKILPWLGALPIPADMHRLKNLTDAIHTRIGEGCAVIVYPEAHVWPYCTKIRNYPATAFHYPVAEQAATFAMTTTYQKRRFGKKPGITVFVDGPFYPDETLKPAGQRKQLHEQVMEAMKKRSAANTAVYIDYRKAEEEVGK